MVDGCGSTVASGPLARSIPARSCPPVRGSASSRLTEPLPSCGRTRSADKDACMDAGIIAAIVIAVVVIVVIIRMVRIVPQARAAVVERFGRYVRTQGPGLTLLLPFV